MTRPLAVLESHPVQYHAPVYRALAAAGIPVVAVYGSDFSVVGYNDREFGATFAWDTDLLGGYESRFLGRVAEGGAKSADLVTGLGLDRHLAELNPSAVLVCGYSGAFDRAAIRAARALRIPTILRAETTDHAKRRSPLKSLVRDWYLRRFYRRCSALCAIGIRSRRHLLRLGASPSKIFDSRYCVDPAPFRTTDADRDACRDRVRTDMGVTEEQIVVIYSGKIAPRKGVDLIPHAVRLLPESLRRRIAIAFLGDGELRDRIAAEAENAPALSVRFLGFQNQTKLSDFYHAADLLVLPSREGETWGLVVNDALHHGLPVVASDAVGCVPDLIVPGETGEVFASDDAADFAAAMTRVIPRLGLVEVRGACRAHVAKYSVAAAAAGIAEAYRSVTA